MPEEAPLEMDAIKAILEALIYVSEEPVKEEEVVGVFPQEQGGTVKRALEELILEYSAAPRGLRIVKVAGGYRMQTRPEHDGWIRALYRIRNKVRLSRAALETLAIIAYRQPVTTPEIQAIRGINPMGVIQTLLERRMIRALGRKKVVGKPILYGTTEEFLVHFGLNSLADLPSLEEFPDLASEEPHTDAGAPAAMEGLPSEGPEIRTVPSGEMGAYGNRGEDEDLFLNELPAEPETDRLSAPSGSDSDEEE